MPKIVLRSGAVPTLEVGNTVVNLNTLGSGTGATGADNNPVFCENDQNVTGSYSITSGKNAMSAGPITIDAGVTVTIPAGSEWTIV